MKASELALREQITMYSEKYEEFHKALLQSNSAIGDFKAEMERVIFIILFYLFSFDKCLSDELSLTYIFSLFMLFNYDVFLMLILY